MDIITEELEKQASRTTVSSTQLSQEATEDFDISLERLRRLEPRIEEMRRRFQVLSQETKLDGTVAKIDGCRSFDEWCEKILHKPVKVVMYLLRGGSGVVKPKERRETEIRSLSFNSQELQILTSLFDSLGLSGNKEKKKFLHDTFFAYLKAL